MKLIREYSDNLQYLKEPEKEIVNNLIKPKKLPEKINNSIINAINNLLKEVDVIEIDADKIISTLFPKNQMVSTDELQHAFSSLLNDLIGSKNENEIRIKLK